MVSTRKKGIAAASQAWVSGNDFFGTASTSSPSVVERRLNLTGHGDGRPKQACHTRWATQLVVNADRIVAPEIWGTRHNATRSGRGGPHPSQSAQIPTTAGSLRLGTEAFLPRYAGTPPACR